MSKQVIVFTGGGTAGHVTPNIAIMKELDSENGISIMSVLTMVLRKN